MYRVFGLLLGVVIWGWSLSSSPRIALLLPGQTVPQVAYSVDWDIDQARKEASVEHYGEEIEPIVEDAMDNNRANPDSDPRLAEEVEHINEGYDNSVIDNLKETAEQVPKQAKAVGQKLK